VLGSRVVWSEGVKDGIEVGIFEGNVVESNVGIDDGI